MDPREADAAVHLAIARQDAEVLTKARLDAGESLAEISGTAPLLERARTATRS